MKQLPLKQKSLNEKIFLINEIIVCQTKEDKKNMKKKNF